MNKILEKKVLAPTLKQIVVNAPLIARKAKAGQFVILRVHERGERFPLTIADYDREKGTITLIFQEVGASTKLLGNLEVGDVILDLVGPLGKATKHPHAKRVVCIGGGVGVAPVYPEAKELYENGVEVISIIGARNKDLLFYVDEMKKVSKELYITTDDGSAGRKGFVTDALKDLILSGMEIDCVIAIGPMPMMKAVSNLTKEYGIYTIVSLNSLMVDGTGMCGGCRVTIGNEVKFACIDGPAFEAHSIDFDEQMRRLRMYQEEEKLVDCKCGEAEKNVEN
ncbi:sulfide/dihydroorotate dehydrogenase-like FAD/NAD-binding protein [Anaerobranca gottschalkii]|uniref:Ferredoxin--NADP+ reductase n=1 Tax=Anaerobranca gottschalkii DSM 13577 TaxID=1120990 RepID=A0A1H9Y2G7_9FIRM|nr:sulfide/dihydroorotate dehydrogenase-like FAD/NAD-binding protein [Anaerobranca gottschalkii]SES62850.1 ferredoxin--NADP+ reductase [Anaerobranca gottschalkii DSM 13577]